MLLLIILKIYPNSPWAQGAEEVSLARRSWRRTRLRLSAAGKPTCNKMCAQPAAPCCTQKPANGNMSSNHTKHAFWTHFCSQCSSCFIVLCLVFISPRNGTRWWENIAELLGKATLHWSKTWRTGEGRVFGYSLAMLDSKTGLGDLERIERYRIYRIL